MGDCLAKRRIKEEQEKKLLMSQGYYECSGCGALLKPKSRRRGECGNLSHSAKRAIFAVVAVAIVLTASIVIYSYYPREKEYRVLFKSLTSGGR